jgi:hypothetical protein
MHCTIDVVKRVWGLYDDVCDAAKNGTELGEGEELIICKLAINIVGANHGVQQHTEHVVGIVCTASGVTLAKMDA